VREHPDPGLTTTTNDAVTRWLTVAASTADQAVAALRERWPDWQIWYVPRAIGGLLWCARLHSDHKMVINAESPDELEEQLVGRTEQ
jgi:hypothetical protein